MIVPTLLLALAIQLGWNVFVAHSSLMMVPITAFVTTTPPRTIRPFSTAAFRKHAAAGGVLMSTAPMEMATSTDKESQEEEEDETSSDDDISRRRLWKDLCQAVQVEPQGLLRLDESGGVRGVYLNKSVKAGDTVLSLDLSKCLRDDQPPAWMPTQSDEASSSFAWSSDWATRLAASLVHEQLQLGKSKNNHDDEEEDANNKYKRLWFALLPNPDTLRASLPVHWDESAIQGARSTALELAVDTAYFTRAAAVHDLVTAMKDRVMSSDEDDDDDEERQRLVQNALDIVQTRTCRVEQPLLLQPATPSSSALRLLAPVFDFINHEATPNACFELLPGAGDNNDGDDRARLVVRALEDLECDQEVTIDYGESARPDWKCLNSYGFVPAKQPDDDEEEEDGAVAEVYMDGIRYEVGPTSIPEAMVAAARDTLLFEQGGASSAKDDALTEDITNGSADDDGVELTPEIAVRLARRLSDAAYHLLLDPPARATAVDAEPCDVDMEEDECEDDDDDYAYEEEYEDDELPETILSKQLAAQLRFSSHRILLKCSLGLHDWAVRQQIHP